MLARPGALPHGPGWAFEVKWDGFRALVSTVDGRERLNHDRGFLESERLQVDRWSYRPPPLGRSATLLERSFRGRPARAAEPGCSKALFLAPKLSRPGTQQVPSNKRVENRSRTAFEGERTAGTGTDGREVRACTARLSQNASSCFATIVDSQTRER
jgi:hypothetical protein